MIPFEDDHNGILLEIEQLGEKFDFLIGAFNSSQILFFASCKQLGTYNVCVALPRSHPLAKKKKLSITDLYNEKLLCVSSGDCLNIDDFRANEKTFQILTQVAGRAGREQEKGRVIIQTYNPDNFSIECSKEQNYDLFYETEIKLRKQLKYPPFCDIITICISSEDEKTTIETIKKLHTYLKKKIKTDNIGVILYSPLPAPIDKIKNKYRWRMIIKCKFGEDIVKFINGMLEEYNKYKKNNTKISIALNPSNMS